jgi:beta-aspartyl-peptidase (threonine type)
MEAKPILVVHGGAWDIPDDEVKNHLIGIKNALETGWDVLRNGGLALDAVEETVAAMEDDSTFDAGKGSVLNTDGSVEMDASIMDGRTFDAGGVAVLRNFPNPIRIARKVLEKTEHILLAGQGCEAFAREQGFHQVPIEELLTTRELKRLDKLIRDKKFRTPHAFGGKRGTVGAAAMDADGNLAAATSTGGTPKKIPGRVGDTPLIGCGTYAENGVGAVSCTGWGESIMKVMLAREVIENIRSGSDAQAASEKSIETLHTRTSGLGGVICVDAQGRIGMTFNTPRMARGYRMPDMETPVVEIE